MAQKLGHSGYPEFRTALQELYRQEVAPGKKLGRALAEVADGEIYARLVETEIAYLREPINSIRPEDIFRAAELISGAKRIFICGRGPQGPLRNSSVPAPPAPFGRNTRAGGGTGDPGEAAATYFPRDFGRLHLPLHPQGSSERIGTGEGSGGPVILITDTVVREMVSDVAVIPAARRGPAGIYHTNIVPLAIQTALVLQVAKLRSPEVLEHLGRLQELRRRFGYEHYLRRVHTSGSD